METAPFRLEVQGLMFKLFHTVGTLTRSRSKYYPILRCLKLPEIVINQCKARDFALARQSQTLRSGE